MKKLYTLSFLLVAALGFSQTYIPFTGTGALTANGWTTHSGATGQLTIVSTPSDSGNSLSYPGLAASTGNRTSLVAGNTEDVNFPLTSPLTSGPVYYSALIKVLDDAQLTANSSTGDYGLALTSVATATTTAFQARIYLKKGSATGTFVLGVLNGSGGTAAPSYITNDLNINTTYLVVVKYDLSANTASLFINPTPGGTEPAVANASNNTGTSAAPAQIAGFVIREGGSATSGTGNVEVDEIKVNTTWASVTGTTLKVNENTIAGLKIYPNPVTNGTLFIETSSNAEKAVTIFDVLGKQVLNTIISNSSVNVANLRSGVYVIKVTEEGKTVSRKLVIE
jgi:hypothetical protein